MNRCLHDDHPDHCPICERDRLRARVGELEALLDRIKQAIKAEQGGAYLACELLGAVLYTEIMRFKR